MIDKGKVNVLGVMVDAVNYEGAVARILDAARRRQPLAVTALAVHGVMTGVMDATHRHRLNHIDLVTPDGQPVRWAMNLLHKSELADRVYGPNLTLQVCEAAAEEGLPIFLFGADEKMLDRLSRRLREDFPGITIAGTRPSKFRTLSLEEKRELVQEVKASGAQIMLVGIGCPRQEVFVYEMREEIGMPMLAVGAAFAFHADSLPQAPRWMQNSGLEWFYRLCQEPTRLWKRYLLLNPLYLTLLGLQFLRFRTPDPSQTVEPTSEILYG